MTSESYFVYNHNNFPSVAIIDVAPLEELSPALPILSDDDLIMWALSTPLPGDEETQELSPALPILSDDDLIMLALSTPLPDDEETQLAASSEFDYFIDSPQSPTIDAEFSLAEFLSLAPLEPVPIVNIENCCDERLSLPDSKASSDEDESDQQTYSQRPKYVAVKKQIKKRYDNKYFVNKIKSRRLKPAARRNNKRSPTARDFEYLVSWVGYSEIDDTWEPYKHIKHFLNTSKDDVSKNNVYEVDHIKSRRLKKTSKHQHSTNYEPTDTDFDYLVSWVGYGDDDDTWEPYESIKHLKEDIRAVS